MKTHNHELVDAPDQDARSNGDGDSIPFLWTSVGSIQHYNVQQALKIDTVFQGANGDMLFFFPERAMQCTYRVKED
jgi:hypothetical protein